MSMEMNLEEAAKACKGILRLQGDCGENCKKKHLEGVTLDSRQVEKGFLFIAARGARADGHAFIKKAVEQGALGVVCEEEPEEAANYILVKDSFQALRDIAAYYRGVCQVKMVGITGSVGKTSTKEFIAGVLEQKYKVLKTEGNFNNEIGVPLTLLKIRKDHEAAVLEMGINHFGEMTRLTQMVKPDIVVMTNIGQSHLEFLGSRAGILKAKSEIFTSMNPQGSIVVNGDDDMLVTLPAIKGIQPLHFGLGENNEIYGETLQDEGLFGSVCTIHTRKESFPVQIPLPGKHMVYNALAAAAVGELLSLTGTEIAAGIASVEALGGRNRVVKGENYTLIDDCYNANPASMKAGILLLSSAKGRKVAILGDMLELGNDAAAYHEEVGRFAVKNHVDILICIGTYAKYMAEAARKEKAEVFYFPDKEKFMTEASEILQKGDTLLLKASHSEGFAELVTALLCF